MMHRRLTLILALLVSGLALPLAASSAVGAGAAHAATAAGARATRPKPRKHRPPPPPPPPSAAAAIAVNPANDDQYAFWRTPGGQIEEAYDNGSWHGPRSHGWLAGTAPAAAVNAAGRQFLAFGSVGGHLLEASFGKRWHAPVDLTVAHHWGSAAITTTTPAETVAPRSSHRSLFWRGRDGLIREAFDNGRWHGPFNRHWPTVSAPSAAVSGGVEVVFWTAPGGDLMEARHTRRWSRPLDLTASLHWGRAGHATSAPGIGVNPRTGVQSLFWRGPGNQLYEAIHTAGWSTPSPQGWGAAAAPSATVGADGQTFVLWQGPDARLFQSWNSTGSWVGPVGRWRLNPGGGAYAEVVETTPSLSEHMSPVSDAQFGGPAPRGLPVISVYDRMRYQRVKGVGAAMTDSSAWLIQNELSAATRASLMSNLFTKGGIHLGFALVPMGGSDFSVAGKPYTYDDQPSGQSDPSLTDFSIAHDQSYILPLLRQMLALAPHTETFAVPWSPPGWMKANDQLNDVGHKGTLLSSSYGTLAAYFVKVLQAYAAAGVPIQAIAPENEPRAASAFPAMYFPEPNEAQWLVDNLAPALAAAHLTPKIYGADTSWQLSDYASQLAASPARSVLGGLAWHCYGGVPTVMAGLHSQAPGLDQIVTECAPNLGHFPVPEIAIGALRNWASEVTLWNVATDPAGGPVEAPNTGCRGCRGLVTINESTHQVTYNADYYELGQIGAFVQSGAWRIGSDNFVRYAPQTTSNWASAGLDDVAFRNPDGSHVLVIYNNASTNTRCAVQWRGRALTETLAPGATVTLRWNP